MCEAGLQIGKVALQRRGQPPLSTGGASRSDIAQIHLTQSFGRRKSVNCRMIQTIIPQRHINQETLLVVDDLRLCRVDAEVICRAVADISYQNGHLCRQRRFSHIVG